MKNISNQRLEYIDGIKGSCSVLVILCHLACVFFPAYYSLSSTPSLMQKIIIGSPLNILTNGNTAVQTFFVVSGFLISRKCYMKKENSSDIILSPIRIYKRLLSIVIPAVTFATLLMCFGFMKHMQAYEMCSTLRFVKDYNTFKPSFISCVLDMFVKTFISRSQYVGPLWTIRYEFFGSIIISCVSFCCMKTEKHMTKVSIYMCFVLLFSIVEPNLTGFFFGGFLTEFLSWRSEETKDGEPNRLYKLFDHVAFRVVLFFVGLYFASANLSFSGIYGCFSYIPSLKKVAPVLRAFGIAIILICFHYSPTMKKIFSIKILSRYLGRLSPYIYAFHWPIILSAGCGSFLIFYNSVGYKWSAVMASALSIILSVAIAWLYQILYNRIKKKREKIKNNTL